MFMTVTVHYFLFQDSTPAKKRKLESTEEKTKKKRKSSVSPC